MKLITEGVQLLDGYSELNEAQGGGTEKNYYISGIFSTPGKVNRNGRIYSRALWDAEVQKYQTQIREKSVNSLGELRHPPRSTVDPLKAVIRIVELKINEEGNVVGKAKILNDNTEQTNKLKGLIKEGIKIGVSSRGVGKVSSTGVVEDFKLITYDVVDMPSDYNAMLNGVVEGVQFINGIAQNKEYTINEDGCIGEVCNSPSINESDELCPIQEKINDAISEVRRDLLEDINIYLADSFKRIEEVTKLNRESLIRDISMYFDNLKRGERNNRDKKAHNDTAIAEALIRAFNEKVRR